MGGFFSSPQAQAMPPTPVERFPGLQNLGQNLMQFYSNILSGGMRQMPYQGYQSVYGGPGGSFPGIYSNQPQQQPSMQGFLSQLMDPNGPLMQAIKNMIGGGQTPGMNFTGGGGGGDRMPGAGLGLGTMGGNVAGGRQVSGGPGGVQGGDLTAGND